jgi:uncharacterized repeat protein (TIGR01451 family)
MSNLRSLRPIFAALLLLAPFLMGSLRTRAAEAPLAVVIINEVDSDQAGTDSEEFIELYDGGAGNTDLTGLVLVTYNGSPSGDPSYNLGGFSNAIDLDGYSTDANGYFVIGNTGVTNVDLTFGGNTLQNGADAVALYTGDGTDFPSGTAPTTTDLIDAVVYDTNNADDAGLLILLNASEPQVNEDGGTDSTTDSNQRCPNGSGGTRNTSSYDQFPPTPGAENTCGVVDTPPSVSSTTPADSATGVAISANITIDFDEDVTVTDPWFDISCGTSGAHTAADSGGPASYTLNPDTDFANGETCTVTIDALMVEDLDGTPDNMAADYVFSFTTAAAVATSVIINEVDSDQSGTDSAEFIELYDGGAGNTDLTGLVLVTYNGSPSGDPSYNLGGFSSAIDLDGYSTDANGYFVIGNSGVANVDLVFSNNTLQNGADAVALYAADGSDFPAGTSPTTADLVDALVYDTNNADDAGLLVLLNASEPQVNEDGGTGSTTDSNQRCPNGTGGARNTSTYDQFPPTPGTQNTCGVVTPEADLSLTKTDSADPVLAGTSLTYTVTVTNNGPDAATGVVVTDTLPAGVTFVSTSGCAEDAAGVPVCTLGTIPAAGSDSYTILVTVDAGTTGVITNTATTTSDLADPNTADNTAAEDTAVLALPSITIVKNAIPADGTDFGFTSDLGAFTLDDEPVQPNDTYTDTIVFDSLLPGGYTFTETVTAGWTLASLACDSGSWGVSGGSVTVNLAAGADITCTFTNTADSGGVFDLAKSDGDVTITFGTTVYYTLAFTNTSAVTATHVTITETVPLGTDFDASENPPGWAGCVDGSPGGTVCTYAVGDLAPGASASVIFAVRPPAVSGGTPFVISNTALIGDDSGNTASASDTTPVVNATVHVANIIMVDASTLNYYKVNFTFIIVNQFGQGVDGIVFHGHLIAQPDGLTGAYAKFTTGGGLAYKWSRSRNPGAYTVCAVNVSGPGVTYDSGSNVETCDTLTVPAAAPPLPGWVFAANGKAAAGQTVQFNGAYLDPNEPGNTIYILWDFGDGGIAAGTLTPYHVYASPGVYTVTLTITDDGGTQSSTITIIVGYQVFLPVVIR